MSDKLRMVLMVGAAVFIGCLIIFFLINLKKPKSYSFWEVLAGAAFLAVCVMAYGLLGSG
jgi:hypothetical protein